MKALSYWASRHVWQARLFVILIGIFRGVVGVLFGFMFLKNMNSAQMNIAACLLFSIIIGVEIYFNHQKLKMLAAPDKLYSFRIRCLSILYTCNLLLFMLVGNAVYRFEPSPEVMDKTTLQSIILPKNTPSVNPSKKQGWEKKRLFSLEQLRTKWQQRLKSDEENMSENQATILGVLLLLLCYPLFLLTCSAACSGDESLAICLLLLMISSFVGGVYFIGKGIRIARKTREKQLFNEEQIKANKLKTHPPTRSKPIIKHTEKTPKTPEEIAEEKTQKKICSENSAYFVYRCGACITDVFMKKTTFAFHSHNHSFHQIDIGQK